jgi:trigger factor
VAFDGGSATDFTFVLGEGQMLPEFENAARGMKAGESKTFPLPFPDNYPGTSVAGKTAEFTLTLKKIEWAHLPAVDADLARALGVADGSVEKMYQEIEDNLKREVKTRIAARNRDAVMEALLKLSAFDLPQALVENEIDQLIELSQRDMASRGREITKDMTFPRDLFREQAEKRTRLGLMLSKIVEDNNIQALQEDLQARANDIAASYQNPKMVANYYLNDKARKQELESMVMEEKVVNFILSQAKVTEKNLPFDELMAQSA